VSFSRYELVDLLGWADNGQSYQRLEESLHRWVGVTLQYDRSWWDNKVKCRVDASFHIIDRVVIYDREVRCELRARQQPLPLSNFTWGKDFFDSCQANYLKRIDLDTYFSLKSAISKQLFRFLDKRFYHRGDLTFDLEELAFEHVGLGRNYDIGGIKRKLRPALEELEEVGFLEPMADANRYTKVRRGRWDIHLVRKLPPPAEAKPAEVEPEPTGLERELVDRGVTRAVAADLVKDFPEDRIRRQIEVVDWLRETKPKRIKDLGAYLAKAIREDYAAPAGFEGKAQRAEAERAERAQTERDEQARRAKARNREIESRIRAYWEDLPRERRAALEAEALAGADPADRAAYEAAAPPVRRMLQAGLRDAHLRRLLGLPAAD
jgi:hypothetical protein